MAGDFYYINEKFIRPTELLHIKVEVFSSFFNHNISVNCQIYENGLLLIFFKYFYAYFYVIIHHLLWISVIKVCFYYII